MESRGHLVSPVAGVLLVLLEPLELLVLWEPQDQQVSLEITVSQGHRVTVEPRAYKDLVGLQDQLVLQGLLVYRARQAL